jgi:hypothetical protein
MMHELSRSQLGIDALDVSYIVPVMLKAVSVNVRHQLLSADHLFGQGYSTRLAPGGVSGGLSVVQDYVVRRALPSRCNPRPL